MMATEDLLLAYADLGDGNSVTEIIQETLNKSESLVTGPVFSPRFLADLYVRLSLAPQSESNEQAFTKVDTWLLRRMFHSIGGLLELVCLFRFLTY